MRKNHLVWAVMLAIAGMGLNSAFGQPPSPAPGAPLPARPTLSPYLNLLDRTNSPAFNYYNRVRPRQAFDAYRQQTGSELQNLNRRIDANKLAIQQSANSQLQPTGHQTRFLDLGGYYSSGPSGVR